MARRPAEMDEELRSFFRAHGFHKVHEDLRFDRDVPLPAMRSARARAHWWFLSGALAALLIAIAVALPNVRGPQVAPPRPGARVRLPYGFPTVGALLGSLGPVLLEGTKLPVLLPASIPDDSPHAGHHWNAIYRTSRSSYELAIYGGPPLAVNSPKVAEGGNASFLMMIRGAATKAGLKTQQFGPLTAWQPTAAQGEVSLGNGIVATNFSPGTPGPVSVTWKEDGWTFVLSPTPASENPDTLAAGIAQSALGERLPGSNGTAVFTIGSDAPSLAVFRLHGIWYSVWANGGKALTYASTMTRVH